MSLTARLRTVSRNNKGFTLVEVMIAMVVMLIGLLGLLHAVTVAVDNNLTNILRDEAVKIAEERMNGVLVDKDNTAHPGLKNVPFDLIASDPEAFTVRRDFRNFSADYSVQATVAALSAESRSLQVRVTWTYKGKDYQHSITSVVTRES